MRLPSCKLALNMNFEELWHVCKFEMPSYPIFGIWPHISKQTYTPSCNAVPLAWGLIRLVPIINHLISRISLVPKLSGAWE